MINLRFFILLGTALSIFVLSLLYLPYDIASKIQPNLRFAVSIFAVLIPLTLNIKGKVEAISNIDHLKHKQIRHVRDVISGYIYRIWTVWILYTFTVLVWFGVSFFNFQEANSLIIGVGLSFSLGWIIFLSLLNLFSVDMSVTTLSVYMKELSLKYKEKEAALELLNKESDFTDAQKDYFASSLTPIAEPKPRYRVPSEK